MLFLIYVNDLPNCLDIACAEIFADDTNITIPGCTFADLEQEAKRYSWLKANELSLEVEATAFMGDSARQKFLVENSSEINIQLDSPPICRVEHAKSLGLITDY